MVEQNKKNKKKRINKLISSACFLDQVGRYSLQPECVFLFCFFFFHLFIIIIIIVRFSYLVEKLLLLANHISEISHPVV